MSVAREQDLPKKSWGWLWVVLGTVAMVLAVFTTLGRVYFHDEPPPDDADLRVRDPVVPVEQNGLVQLRKLPADPVDFIKFATSKGVDEDEAHKIREGTSANDTLVDEFLVQAQPALTKLDDILQMPYFAYNDEISPNDQFPEVEIVPNYARALRLSARRNQALGDYPAAVRDAGRLRLLARRLIEGHSTVLNVLTACTANAINRRMTQKLLDDPALPPASEAVLTQEFSREISWTGGMQRSLCYEYLVLAKALETTAQGRAIDSPTTDSLIAGDPFIQSSVKSIIKLGLKVNATERAAADFYRQLREVLNEPYSATQGNAFAALQNYIGSSDNVKFWIRPNLGGRFFLEMPTASIEGIIATIYMNIAEDRMLQTDGALRHYFDDHQALPGKLEDLVPAYLPAVPHDPFDGHPLRYDAERGLVYSVGTSLKDSGGSGFLKMSKDAPNYQDPLNDKTQPTLQLEFQKRLVARPGEAKPAN